MNVELYNCSLLFFLGAAACADRLTRRIPNRLILLGLAAAALGKIWLVSPLLPFLRPARAAALILLPLGQSLGLAALVLAAGFPLAAAGMLGAGDVKLMALMVFWLGLGLGAAAIFTGFFLAALWALKRMTLGKTLAERLQYFCRYAGECLARGRLEPYRSKKSPDFNALMLMAPFFFLGTAAVLVLSICL